MNTEIPWQTAKQYEDITYKKCNGVARIAFNRPEVRNAFRPRTTSELIDALRDATEDTSIAYSSPPKALLPKMGYGLSVVGVTSAYVASRAM